MINFSKPTDLISAKRALPGRPTAIKTASTHAVFNRPLTASAPQGMQSAMFGMGCFWGAERLFWQLPGVHMTMVGYAGGYTPNPTYEEVCGGRTGHAEVVWVVFDPKEITYDDLLKVFWEGHDPTQGMAQGNDRGTQYRSAIYVMDDTQMEAAKSSAAAFGKGLAAQGYGEITTEILPAPDFYHAEAFHQQYLQKNPGGYCGLSGTGVTCSIGLAEAD